MPVYIVPLILILSAPILQILLSCLRIKGRIWLPIGAITFLMLILGVFLSYIQAKIVWDRIIFKPGEVRCATGVATIFIGQSFLNIVAVMIIGITSGLIYYFKYRKQSIKPI